MLIFILILIYIINLILYFIADSAKSKWKNLRDSYMRYKKCVQGETGQAKKYHKWPWSSHLEFLVDSIKYRPQCSNITESAENIITPPKEKTPPIVQNLQKSNFSSDESPSSLRMKPQKKIKIRPKESSEVDRVIEYLENKKKPKIHDGIDHLFLSYSDTFKKFHPRTQAELKIKIATLFAQTEMKEMQYYEQNISPVYSDNSTTNYQYYVGSQSSSNSVPSSETSYKSSDTSLTSARDFYESASNYSIVDLLGLPPTSN